MRFCYQIDRICFHVQQLKASLSDVGSLCEFLLGFPYFLEFIIIDFLKNQSEGFIFILVHAFLSLENLEEYSYLNKCEFGKQCSYCGTSFYFMMTHFDLLLSVLDGYNGTIMAYGQTGTGKTYTLGRLGEEDNAARGIMVRAMEDILADVSLETDSVSVSYLQVLCNEKDFGISF